MPTQTYCIHTWKHVLQACQTCALMHTQTGMHAHTPLMRMEISLSLCCLPPAVRKSKKLEVFSFMFSRSWTVPGNQTQKSLVTIISLPLFSSSEQSVLSSAILPILMLVSAVFNWTFTYRRMTVFSPEYMMQIDTLLCSTTMHCRSRSNAVFKTLLS